MKRFIGAILVACYGILSVIATAPHLHHRMSPVSGVGSDHEVVTAAIAPAPTIPLRDPAGGSGCQLCGWGRSSARISPVSTLLGGTQPTMVVRSESQPRVFVDPPAGNILERAPPAA